MDFRKIFNSIPEQFDVWRPYYCDELFADIIEYTNLDSEKTALEVGTGTGGQQLVKKLNLCLTQ